MEKPSYNLIAGINGAGKSSFYSYLNERDRNDLGCRINYDEMFVKYGNELEAGIKCIKLTKKYLNERTTFHQETTLTGHTIFNNISLSRELGYKIVLHYIGVASCDIAIARVQQRVLDGGHDIPTEDIIRRYQKSLDNLCKTMSISDDIYIYDNTKSFKQILTIRNNRFVHIDRKMPKWFLPSLLEYVNYKI